MKFKYKYIINKGTIVTVVQFATSATIDQIQRKYLGEEEKLLIGCCEIHKSMTTTSERKLTFHLDELFIEEEDEFYVFLLPENEKNYNFLEVDYRNVTVELIKE